MLLTGVAVWLLVLFGRLVDLQVLRKDEFVKRARRQQERTVELPPRRGAITDREGRPLAVTREVDSVFAIPSDVKDPKQTAQELADVLRVSPKELARKLSDGDRDFVWIARRVPEETARKVAARKLLGVRLLKEYTRHYPQGPLAASVVGTVGADNQGLAGLEHRFESEVRGRPARVTLMKDAAQRSYAEAGRDARPALAEVEGSSLVLTLDAAVQHVAERELARGADEFRARAGSAVVMDPQTGAVLALASYPSFDTNRYNDAEPDARRCRAVADVYEPGSTFKMVTAAAALDAGTVAADDVIDCGNGTLTIGRTTIHEHGHNRWAILPLADVLAHSSNIGAAHLGLGLGRGPFHRAVRSFGFGQKTGIELEGETSGLLADPARWSALTLPTMSFGQEIGVTVLQMARAYSAVANGGTLPWPHLVQELRSPGGAVRRGGIRPSPRVVTEETAAILRRMLARVVSTGTGKLAAVPGYSVAGKTGTAQKANPGAGYWRDKHVASFIGFLPADHPRVVIAVVLDEPKGKIYGGDVAAPVFARIATDVMPLLHEVPERREERLLPPVLTADLAVGASAVTASVLSDDVLPASTKGRALRRSEETVPGTVPDVTGLSSRDAARTLALAGLVPRLSGHGFVIAQDPAPGVVIEPGDGCRLTLAIRPLPLAPTEAEAIAALEAVP